ncbi:MAG: O-antigen ligase family protein [Chloroflexota bacterium]
MKLGSRGLYALAASLGIGAFAGMAILGLRTPEAILASAVASICAAATVVLAVERPVVAVGLLFLLASISGVVIGLPVGRVRLEQPSIVAAVIMLILTRAWPRRSEIRPLVPIMAAFGVYLVVLTIASALYAPKPPVSVRMITWTVISMAAGVATFALLIRPSTDRIESWFTGTGVVHAVVGLTIAAAFLFLGPTGIPGMQTSPGEVPKVAGLAYEANLFASMLGAVAPFALDRFRSDPRLTTAVVLLLVIVGMGLGVTRGAYLGLGIGLLTYLAIVAYRNPRPADIVGIIPVLVVALLLAPSISGITLPVERVEIATGSPSPGATHTPAAARTPDTRPSPPPSPSPSQRPIPTPSPAVDTIDYRVDRIPTALEDLRDSPIIGLGAATFGQRHELPDVLAGTPDYIGILALVALYESGIVGAAALALGFALSFRLLLRLSRASPGRAAAYVASLVSLLAAYQATNALFFSINWIILGAGLALAVRMASTSHTRAS